jgi:hypothetical protein
MLFDLEWKDLGGTWNKYSTKHSGNKVFFAGFPFRSEEECGIMCSGEHKEKPRSAKRFSFAAHDLAMPSYSAGLLHKDLWYNVL